MGWNKFTREYFTERETLVAVLLLVDASIPPMEIDVACADWFGDAEVRGAGCGRAGCGGFLCEVAAVAGSM